MPLIRSRPDKPDVDRPSVDLRATLLSGSPEERWTAARTVAELRVRGDALLLAQALELEKDSRVREAIFTGLARIATSESVLAVLPYLRSDDANLRTGALDALRMMPDATRPHLEALLGDPDADVRLLTCDLTRSQPGPDTMRVLTALLETEPEANVCAAAVEVLAEVGSPLAVPSLLRCADRFRSDPFLGFAIKHVIVRLGSPSSVAGD
jgi:HEAT repeat protein